MIKQQSIDENNETLEKEKEALAKLQKENIEL